MHVARPFFVPHALRAERDRAQIMRSPTPSSKTSVFELSKNDASVVTAEPERVRNGDGDVSVARCIRDVIEVALRVLDLVVDRRRELAVADREDGERRLDRTRGAEAMPGRALRAGDGRRARVLLRSEEHT